MLQKILSNKISVVYIVLVLAGLIFVRWFEAQLFYDPLLAYYKQNFKAIQFPEIDCLKYAQSLLWRYLINSILSVVLLWVLFKDKNLLSFSSFLFVVLFILLIIVFFCLLYFDADSNKTTLFYVRRFIIQPIFIIVFIPAFWYQIYYHK